jgi:ABC-2 type transport system ATP-binding protein
VLTASHLTRRFGDRTAVADVSFDISPGEVFALLGPNGAGKTTTLRMLAGLIQPTSGVVRIEGQPMTGRSASLRARIGFLTEAPGLWERLTIRENLVTYARLYGLERIDAAVDRALETFALASRGAERTATLSKGLKQRVALARTLLHDPPIVLLDEPTAGLDPEMARDVREIVLRLRDRRRIIVISTHNLDEVDRVASRVAVLRTRLVALDTPAALRARVFGARLRVVVKGAAAALVAVLQRLGFTDVTAEDDTLSIGVASPADAAPEVVRQLVAAGAAIRSVVSEQPALEEVYLRLLEAQP